MAWCVRAKTIFQFFFRFHICSDISSSRVRHVHIILRNSLLFVCPELECYSEFLMVLPRLVCSTINWKKQGIWLGSQKYQSDECSRWRHEKYWYNEGEVCTVPTSLLLFHIIKKCFGDDFHNRNNHFMSVGEWEKRWSSRAKKQMWRRKKWDVEKKLEWFMEKYQKAAGSDMDKVWSDGALVAVNRWFLIIILSARMFY